MREYSSGVVEKTDVTRKNPMRLRKSGHVREKSCTVGEV